ncbi:MAG TPA: hypothetical protein VFZ21_10280 [Gemmatimonadaceae bacterium]|nr:hypothetical protein [Gemmatimonadaceae bacterium]
MSVRTGLGAAIAVAALIRAPRPATAQTPVAQAPVQQAPVQQDAAQPGITLAEMIELKRSGVSSRQILRSAQTYCIAFLLSDSVARIIGDSLDQTMVEPLRQACTTESAIAHVEPGTLLDADFGRASAIREFVSQDRLCSVRYERPGLRFANRRQGGGCVIGYPSDAVDGELRIELTVSDLASRRTNTVVLGFGRIREEWNHYSYSIDAQQQVELCVNVRTTCRRLLQRARVAAVSVQPGAKNRLEVELRGRNIHLGVNGQRVATYVADAPVTGTLVLGTGANSSVIFERLTVRDLIGERATAVR